MQRQLEVVRLIKENPYKWEELLGNDPYRVTVKHEEDQVHHYVILNYNQIESDFSEQISRECRGLILDITVPTAPVVVRMAFEKFGNLGEGYCPEIRWEEAWVQEKVDGSMCSLWWCPYLENWRVSTMSCIDARTAIISHAAAGYEATSFAKLFWLAFRHTSNGLWGPDEHYDKNYCYTYELCTPINRIVTPHKEFKLVHIGTRDMRTLEEIETQSYAIPKPKSFYFTSLEECVEAAKQLSFSEEGFVVKDANYNRIKIKSPAYLAAFYLRNNGRLTLERVLDMLQSDGGKEFMSYYPEYETLFTGVEYAKRFIMCFLLGAIDILSRIHFETQKDFALAVKDTEFAPYFFRWYKSGQNLPPTQWMMELSSKQLASFIKPYLPNYINYGDGIRTLSESSEPGQDS